MSLVKFATDDQNATDADRAADVKEKIRKSACEIVGYKEGAILSCPTALLPFAGPFARQIIVDLCLKGLCRALCKIWEVPRQFKESLKRNLVSQESYDKQFSSLSQKLRTLSPVVDSLAVVKPNTPDSVAIAAVGQAKLTSRKPVSMATAVGLVSALENEAHVSMMAMVSLGIMVTGAILYVKAKYDPHGWDKERPMLDYDELINEFKELHGPDLMQHIGKHHAIADVFSRDRDREQVIKQLEDYSENIIREQLIKQPENHNDPDLFFLSFFWQGLVARLYLILSLILSNLVCSIIWVLLATLPDGFALPIVWFLSVTFPDRFAMNWRPTPFYKESKKARISCKVGIVGTYY